MAVWMIFGTLGLLTLATVSLRTVSWLRILVVLLCGVTIGIDIVFGYWVVFRMGMPDDVELMRSTANYGEAFKAGLLAAQEAVNHLTRTHLIVVGYLVIMALVPVRSKPR